MNFKYFRWFLLFVALFLSCNTKKQHYKEADRVINQFVKEMTQRYDVKLWAYGGSMIDNIKLIDLHFEANLEYDLDQARFFFINFNENLLRQINSDKKLRPYLSNFPFTNTNLSIIIGFRDHDNLYPQKEYISGCFLSRGIVSYSVYDKANDKLILVHRETYEEALRKVQEEKTDSVCNY